MSNYNKCPTCKEYVWTEKHNCPPVFYFKHENWGDDFEEIRAHSFEDAAERFAKLYNDDGDYSLMDNEEHVIISDGKTEKKFIVSAEPDISYHVSEICRGD